MLDEDKRHLPLAALAPDLAERTITLIAPSKTFNTPGLGCSFAVISDPSLRRAFCHTMEGIVPHVNLFGYVAAQAAYEKGGAWLRALLDYLRGNRDLVEREVSSMPGLRITHVEATYLAWIDARDTGLRIPPVSSRRRAWDSPTESTSTLPDSCGSTSAAAGSCSWKRSPACARRWPRRGRSGGSGAPCDSR